MFLFLFLFLFLFQFVFFLLKYLSAICLKKTEIFFILCPDDICYLYFLHFLYTFSIQYDFYSLLYILLSHFCFFSISSQLFSIFHYFIFSLFNFFNFLLHIFYYSTLFFFSVQQHGLRPPTSIILPQKILKIFYFL